MQGRHRFRDRVVLEFCLSEHIPRYTCYYRLKQLLKLEDLYEANKPIYGTCGEKSVHAIVFFKLCLVQHLESKLLGPAKDQYKRPGMSP